jgi:hypothetical protein
VRKAGRQPLHHRIERHDELFQLVIGEPPWNAQVQVGAGNALRRLGYLVHRHQRAAGHKPTQYAGKEQQQWHDRQVVGDEGVRQSGDVGHPAAHNQKVQFILTAEDAIA